MTTWASSSVNGLGAIHRCALFSQSNSHAPTRLFLHVTFLCSQYTYLSLGCSKAAEARMLAFARQQVGKPFSNSGMARSVIFPRQTTGRTYYCAELVAATLKSGGLMCASHSLERCFPTAQS